MNNEEVFAQGNNAINWVRKLNAYQINGYDKSGDRLHPEK